MSAVQDSTKSQLGYRSDLCAQDCTSGEPQSFIYLSSPPADFKQCKIFIKMQQIIRTMVGIICRHDRESCKVCKHVNNDSLETIGVLVHELEESALAGCQASKTLMQAITETSQHPSTIKDGTGYRVSAGGNYPVRIASLELFAVAEAPENLKIGCLFPISESPGSEQSIDRIFSWIKFCNDNHQSTLCQPVETPVLPHRVLDLGHTDEEIRLLETEDIHGQYVALSHRWGSERGCITTTDNIEVRKQHIPWQELPETFRDAVTVTRKLGVQYLWVDSLCILQGDGKDWQTESAQMAQIYQNSYFTIAAAVAWGDDEGFLKKRPEQYLSHDAGQGIMYRHQIDHVCNNGQEPIWMRGWCFQERLVPRRVLTFRHAEVTFECRTSHWCECGRNESYYNCPDRMQYERKVLNPSQNAFSGHFDRIMYWYTFLIKEYTRMFMSFERDRLPAISAMAAQILDQAEDRCITGIWESQLLPGLLWRCFGRHCLDRDGTKNIFFPLAKIESERQAPSWSWASVEGPIDYRSLPRENDFRFEANVVELYYPKVCSQPSYIMSSSCSLTLRGRMMNVFVGLPGKLILRGSSIASHPHCSFIINPPPLQPDLAIPLYDVFYDGHLPIQQRCDNCVLVHETVVFWPDTQLILGREHGGTPYLQKCVWPADNGNLEAGHVEVQCFLLYHLSDAIWGGIVLQKSRDNQEAYERLGFIEFYSTHPAFETFEDLQVKVVKIV